jgi:hypothetical protein
MGRKRESCKIKRANRARTKVVVVAASWILISEAFQRPDARLQTQRSIKTLSLCLFRKFEDDSSSAQEQSKRASGHCQMRSSTMDGVLYSNASTSEKSR